jgi:predicted restriction endonuclease
MTVRGPERIGRNADGGVHALPNGLLLRADIHRLYDAGYVTVTSDYRFRVSHDLADDFHNGHEYERFAGRAITVPRAPLDQPNPELLDWHAAEVFRG